MNKEMLLREKKYHIPTYNRQPVEFVRGDDVYLWDSDDKKYIDFVAGLGVVNVGHANKKINAAFCEQADVLSHVSNLFYTKQQVDLAERLVNLSIPDGKCFFGNSGAEANEGAIKLARRYGKINFSPERVEIITALRSFHGRTMKALAATGQPEKHIPFEPLPGGFKHVPYNDIGSLEKATDEKTVGVMLEVIQGEGGVHPADEDYLNSVQKYCADNRLLLMFDEVQTGIGRTGKFFAYQHFGLEPDIVTTAKGLGNGFPIGALIAKPDIADSFTYGDHGSTFGGGPAVCAAALATLDFIEENDLCDQVKRKGDYFIKRLTDLKTDNDHIVEIRGRGLMIGMELKDLSAKEIVTNMLSNGFVINNIGDNILRFLPPLTIEKNHIDQLLTALSKEVKS